MNRKKVAIFGIKYFPSKGGSSRVVENLLWDLKEHFDFTIYCYRHDKAATNIPGVKTIQFSEIPIKGLGVFLFYFRCCFHLMFNGKYDLVHLHKIDSAFFIPILRLKHKLLVTSHALPHLNDKWSGFAKFYFRQMERLFMHSKSISRTAVSKPLTDYYQKTYNGHVHFIPNGIKTSIEVEEKLAIDVLKKHEVNGPYLFFAARRLIPLKGCHTLLEALTNMKFKGTLVVAADTEQLPHYFEELRAAAQNINVKFIGYISSLDTLFALVKRASFFVFPSEIEGMSMMMLEVGNIGTPMVCSDIPPNVAVLGPEEALFFESKNSQDLMNKLQWAFDHPLEMTAKAERAQNKIRQEYSISVVNEQYTQLYNSILGELTPELVEKGA